MGRATVPLLSFNGGEIGTRALARVDLAELYPKCAARMENCWASVQGPLSKVPGSEYRASTPSNGVAILRPFVFDEDDAVMLELSNGKIRFHHPDDGLITLEGAAATIGNFTDASSGGGASVTAGATSTTFTGVDGEEAIARSTITTAAPNDEVTLTFTTTRRALAIRIGTSAGGQEVVPNTTLMPGVHIITFTPTASPYYFEAELAEAGGATLAGLARIAAGILELPTPWAAADLPNLRYEQQRDAMWWYLGDEQTRVLERRGTASWSLRLFAPADGPFDPENLDDAATITPSALAGTATLTASKNLFVATDAGRLVRLTHQGQNVTDTLDGVSQTTAAIRVTGIETDRVFSIEISGTWVGTIQVQRSVGNDLDFADYGAAYTANTTVQIDDGLDNQIIYYRLATTAWTSDSASVAITYARGSTTGYARIYLFNSATSVDVDVLESFGKTSATTDWALGAWSDGEGWPAAGALHGDGRHCLLRTDRLFGSAPDDYESFAVGTAAADAIDRLLSLSNVGTGLWISSVSRLLVGTSGLVAEVRASSFDEPITPDNMTARAIAIKGKAAAPVQPEKMDKRLVYVGKNRTRLYQAVYDLDDNSYTPDDLTRLHKNIAGEGASAGFVELAVQYEPEPRVWVVRTDGQLVVCTMAPEEGVYALSRFVDDGEFESVGVLPGSPENHVFFVIKRTIDGNTVRYVEKLAPENWSTLAEAWRLRSALAAENPADNIISGLGHLEGEAVYALADGRIQGPFTVTGGEITLADDDYDYVIVGLNYSGFWTSAKLSYGATLGTALCQQKHFDHVGFITERCPHDSFKYGRGLAEDELNTWPNPDETTIDPEALDEPLEPLSRDDLNGCNSGWSTDPRLYIVMDQPVPVEILGAVIHIETR